MQRSVQAEAQHQGGPGVVGHRHRPHIEANDYMLHDMLHVHIHVACSGQWHFELENQISLQNLNASLVVLY